MPKHLPTLSAYAAGRTIAPLWVAPTGRAFYPIAGGSDDPPAEPDAPDTPSAESEPAFPANTPVKDMTVEQRAAYHEHQARRHEERNKELLRITGGKYGDDLKALLDERETLLNEKRTDGERAVEEARRQVRDEVVRDMGVKNVRAAFDLLLGDMSEQERNDQVDLLDLNKFLNENGDVDTAKVRTVANRIAPTDKGSGGAGHDFGAGPRRNGNTASGVAAGRQMFADTRTTNPSTS